jgi:hypothetical protein
MKAGVYVNFMSGDEQERVPEAYQERWERMLAIKSHYDPTNFFRMNQNVQPGSLNLQIGERNDAAKTSN